MTFGEWKRLELVREYIPQIVNIELARVQTSANISRPFTTPTARRFIYASMRSAKSCWNATKSSPLWGSSGRWITRRSRTKSRRNMASAASCRTQSLR